ncbi:MAG TPA: prepilin-type N-terminal cleavage/methylation domain-containing protein [Tepidisphaeraceae bacterium]|jgi:prepilin-type N-terminal cleavage/methylation domain-containing protein|nr:prepilin-type N-terminal cleavage/methylation domain-containing protein [Tepidisphaeraceae bacterium]
MTQGNFHLSLICANLRHLRPLCFRARRGFTFTEVMFAVILLGIGFIMLAGMFPVAIQQTQTNVEESTASTLVQSATRSLEQTLTQQDLPPTGHLTPPGTIIYPRFLRLSETCNAAGVIGDDFYLWEKVRGSFILPQDPRFAWTALYKRNPGDNFAQVIIFALQARNYGTYTSLDLERPPSGTNPQFNLATIEPRFLPAILSDGGLPGVPDIIEFYAPDAFSTAIRDGALAEGCFVVVGDDGVATDDNNTPVFDPGYANGRIYRIGSRRTDLDGTNGNSQAWELMPGHDMQSPEENLPLRSSQHGTTVSPPNYTDHKPSGGSQPASVFIIGKGFNDPRSNDYTTSGFAQDIAVYTTFIRLK